MSVPTAEIQTLDPGAILELFVLDLTALGGTVHYFHAGTNQLGTSVVWQGNTYQPWPVKVDGFAWDGQGPLPRPTISVANVDGSIGALVRSYQDLVGAAVTLKTCLAKHLDAVNFPGGVNPTADPTAHFDDEVFEVEQKTAETAEAITFQLASAMDAQGKRLPGRPIQATVCGWGNGDTATCPFVVSCDRLLTTCKTHAATDGVGLPQFAGGLPFGGFPAANRVR